MKADPTLRVRIEGHTCSIGTAEYNLALGDRRARSVQAYLTANGIAPIDCPPSASVKSSRSTTTHAKKRAGSTAART